MRISAVPVGLRNFISRFPTAEAVGFLMLHPRRREIDASNLVRCRAGLELLYAVPVGLRNFISRFPTAEAVGFPMLRPRRNPIGALEWFAPAPELVC